MKVIRFNAYIHGRGSKHRHIPPAFSTRSLSVPNELYLRIFRNLQKSINKIYIDELEFVFLLCRNFIKKEYIVFDI